jgi:peptidoglycan/xylan/chitin deacetylase (PgdA/CDA1 family)
MSDGLIKPVLKVGRGYLKAGMASAFTETGLMDLLNRVRTMTAGPRIHVLGYHRVVDELDLDRRDALVNPSLCITAASFRRQMEQVRARFQVLPLEDALRAIEGQLYLERDAVAITFDDGYHDVIARALPVIREFDLPATVFVPTGPALSGDYLPHDRLYAAFVIALAEDIDLSEAPVPLPLHGWVEKAQEMSRTDGPATATELLIAWLPARSLDALADGFERLTGGSPDLDESARVLTPAEILELAEAGWEIGAHTVDHAVLTHETGDRVERQLLTPRHDIERWTGKRCRYFAYCNGYHSRVLVEAVRRAGYEGAVTTCDRPNYGGGDVYRVSRKCLWEAHTRGADGQFSPAVSAAHLHDLFGDLRMTRPVDGEIPSEWEVLSCAR